MKGCAVMIRFESSQYEFTTLLGPQLHNNMTHKALYFYAVIKAGSPEKVLTGKRNCSVV